MKRHADDNSGFLFPIRPGSLPKICSIQKLEPFVDTESPKLPFVPGGGSRPFLSGPRVISHTIIIMIIKRTVLPHHLGSAYFYSTVSIFSSQTMDKGIFHNRLKNKFGDHNRHKCRFYSNICLYLIPEARLSVSVYNHGYKTIPGKQLYKDRVFPIDARERPENR